jgi:hypothetical protein
MTIRCVKSEGMTMRGRRGTPIAGKLGGRGPAMNQRHVNRTRTRAWGVLLALVVAFALSAPTLAAGTSSSGTVTVTGKVVASIAKPQITGGGTLKLVAKLRITPNKKEWYYVYTFVNSAGNPVPVTIQSNLPWNGTLGAVQTAGDKKKMDLAGGLLHVMASAAPIPMSPPPSTFNFAFADAATPLKTTPVKLDTITGMPSSTFGIGTKTFYQYFLLHVSEGSGSTTFGVNLTYSIGQVPNVYTQTLGPIPFNFDTSTCCS